MLQKKSYQANHHGPHLFNSKSSNPPKWYIIDAKQKTVGRIATLIAKVLTGKHKPTFTRHADTGDFVIVINANQIHFTKGKWDNKMYYDYSGYVGGLKEKTAKEMLEKHPEEILKRAVYGMTNKSNLAKRQVQKLKIYANSEHPHHAQQPEPLPEHLIRKTILERKI